MIAVENVQRIIELGYVLKPDDDRALITLINNHFALGAGPTSGTIRDTTFALVHTTGAKRNRFL
jgi:hypothetical protein